MIVAPIEIARVLKRSFNDIENAIDYADTIARNSFNNCNMEMNKQYAEAAKILREIRS
jgi:hypothetical protein